MGKKANFREWSQIQAATENIYSSINNKSLPKQ